MVSHSKDWQLHFIQSHKDLQNVQVFLGSWNLSTNWSKFAVWPTFGISMQLMTDKYKQHHKSVDLSDCNKCHTIALGKLPYFQYQQRDLEYKCDRSVLQWQHVVMLDSSLSLHGTVHLHKALMSVASVMGVFQQQLYCNSVCSLKFTCHIHVNIHTQIK
jgi:hypothetical protein